MLKFYSYEIYIEILHSDQLLQLKHTEDFTINANLRFDGQALKDNGDSWITDRSVRWFKNRNEGLNVGIGNRENVEIVILG